VGGNGSGKTSLLLTLAGFLKAKGSLEVRGRLGLVFQNPGLQFLTQNILDEILLSLAPDGKGRQNSELVKMAEELGREFGLGAALGRSPWTLSQGQQRRLAVLSMLAADKDVLLLDEPTYAQDDGETRTLMDLLAQKVDGGLAAVFVTHDLVLARSRADRVLRLSAAGLDEI
jgi:energy-coupling factor transport system ATP-binding protein